MQNLTVLGTGVLGSQIILQAAYQGKDVVAYDLSDEILAKLPERWEYLRPLYLRDLPDTRRPWIGSTNQSIRALTPTYADRVRRIDVHGEGDTLEVRIDADGTVSVNGWADDTALAALLDDLGVRADRPQERAA